MEEQRALPDEPPPSPSLPPSWPSSRPATPLPPTPVSLVRDLSGGALGAAGEENPSEGDSNARSRSRPASPSWSEGESNTGDADHARSRRAAPSSGMAEVAGESAARERRGGPVADAAGDAGTRSHGMVGPGTAGAGRSAPGPHLVCHAVRWPLLRFVRTSLACAPSPLCAEGGMPLAVRAVPTASLACAPSPHACAIPRAVASGVTCSRHSRRVAGGALMEAL